MARDGDSAEAVIRRADRALYRAKREGRGRTAMLDEDAEPAR